MIPWCPKIRNRKLIKTVPSNTIFKSASIIRRLEDSILKPYICKSFNSGKFMNRVEKRTIIELD